MDDQTLAKLTEEIEKEGREEFDGEGLKEEDLLKLEGASKDENDIQQSEIRTVTTRTVKTSSTLISKLEKDLLDERIQREKLQKEIDDLKKMNSELCNAILKPPEVKP